MKLHLENDTLCAHPGYTPVSVLPGAIGFYAALPHFLESASGVFNPALKK
jgi:hypothetical protein